MDNFPFRKSLWRKRRQLPQQEIPTQTDLDTAAVIVAAIIGCTLAVMLALSFTLSWLQ